MVLVETKQRLHGGRERKKMLFLGGKRRPEEEVWATARRLLSTELKLPESLTSLETDKIDRIDESKDSPSYPGIKCLYRTFIVGVQIISEDADAVARYALDGGTFETYDTPEAEM